MPNTHNETAFRQFIETFLEKKADPLTIEFFDLFFTLDEKKDFGNRLLIVQALLQQQQPQRQIAKALNVSIAKITRGANELKRISPELRDYLRETLL